jgi:hypothetical protein
MESGRIGPSFHASDTDIVHEFFASVVRSSFIASRTLLRLPRTLSR